MTCLGEERTYCWSWEVPQRIDEEGPDEDQIEERETKIIDEESNYCSGESFWEHLRGRVYRKCGYDAGDREGRVEVTHCDRVRAWRIRGLRFGRSLV